MAPCFARLTPWPSVGRATSATSSLPTIQLRTPAARRIPAPGGVRTGAPIQRFFRIDRPRLATNEAVDHLLGTQYRAARWTFSNSLERAGGARCLTCWHARARRPPCARMSFADPEPRRSRRGRFTALEEIHSRPASRPSPRALPQAIRARPAPGARGHRSIPAR
jgi:hypothetical protein